MTFRKTRREVSIIYPCFSLAFYICEFDRFDKGLVFSPLFFFLFSCNALLFFLCNFSFYEGKRILLNFSMEQHNNYFFLPKIISSRKYEFHTKDLFIAQERFASTMLTICQIEFLLIVDLIIKFL